MCPNLIVQEGDQLPNVQTRSQQQNFECNTTVHLCCSSAATPIAAGAVISTAAFSSVAPITAIPPPLLLLASPNRLELLFSTHWFASLSSLNYFFLPEPVSFVVTVLVCCMTASCSLFHCSRMDRSLPIVTPFHLARARVGSFLRHDNVGSVCRTPLMARPLSSAMRSISFALCTLCSGLLLLSARRHLHFHSCSCATLLMDELANAHFLLIFQKLKDKLN